MVEFKENEFSFKTLYGKFKGENVESVILVELSDIKDRIRHSTCSDFQ